MNILATARLKFDQIIPGHNLKINSRKVPGGGTHREDVKQIIVTGELPKGEIDNVVVDFKTGRFSVDGKTNPGNAFLNAKLAIFKVTGGISTYFVNEREWVDMYEMNYSKFDALEKSGIAQKVTDPSIKLELIPEDKQKMFLNGVKKILKDNGLSPEIASLGKGYSENNKIIMRFLVENLSESDVHKVSLIQDKLNKKFHVSAYSDWNIDRSPSPSKPKTQDEPVGEAIN